MLFLKNLKIRDKLLLLLTVLLIPLFFFLVTSLVQNIQDKNRIQEVLHKLEETKVLSHVLHEFQKERTFSVAYLETKGEEFSNRLNTQRGKTNIALNELSKLQEANPRLTKDLQTLSELTHFRERINQLRIDSLDYETFTKTTVQKLLDRMQANAGTIADEEMRKQISSYLHLTSAKVNLGMLRTLLGRALVTKRFSLQEYGRFETLKSFYDEHIRRFTQTAPPQLLSVYLNHADDNNFRKAMTLLATLENEPTTNLANYDAEHWIGNLTEALELLRKVELANMTATINSMTNTIYRKNQLLFFYIAFVLCMLLLAGFISYYTVKTISNSLQVLKKASDKVYKGYTDVKINIDSTDEIGELADSFRKIVAKNTQLSLVAEAVGEGSYDVEVQVHSEQDVLANALKQMKQKLQTFSKENTNRQWQLQGVTELNNLMSGSNNIEETCREIIKFLVEYVKAEVGVVYLLDDFEKLNFTAGYAFDINPKQLPSFALGEGVIGQAALTNQITVLQEIPANYLKIKTAIAEAAPATVVIVPFYFENDIIGVMELASRNEFKGTTINFLKAVSEKIAIVIHSMKTNLRTQELLYETQNQAEELETQHEELRQVNVELKAQKEQLQASEEELRVNQEELEEKNSELEEHYEAIRVKNREIEDARQAIELKMQQVETISKYKSEFLANMSHELRTPLNSILILSKLMADNTESNLTAKQREHAEIIYNSGSDLLKLINEILDLSKIESGQIQLEIKEFNPKQIRMRGLFDQTARQKQVEFISEFDEALPPSITTDQFRLEQILKNLLSNAFKFTPAGGKVVYQVYPLRQRNSFTNPALQQNQEVIAFSIRDTGIGIPKEKQALVFEAFQQADTSTTRKFGGTGLGLAICRELASLLGGEIRLESEENVGSTFTLYIPRYYLQKESTVIKAPIEKINGQSDTGNGWAKRDEQLSKPGIKELLDTNTPDKKEKSVLIIEDDKGFSQIVADFATHKKFKVHQAFTGKEGLDQIYSHQPDAILLDINLPDISGWEILEHIHENPKLKHIQVHVMSAYDKEVLGRQVEEEYLPKPVTLEMLDKAFGKIREEGKAIQKVLVVEDHTAENLAITELLQAHGIQSVSAYTGNEAFDLLKKEKVDCIILDLKLPDMGGYELMEKVRSSGKNLPIIIYSGKDLSEEEEFQLKKYANTIIIKNEFSYIRLLDEVQLFLHKVNEKLPGEEEFKMKLHIPEEILAGKKVLVVDDDVRNVYSLFNLLEQHQMKIVVANDGKEALDKIATENGIDIVLMDVMMPEMDGIETTRRIRQNPAFAKLPIIALTAKAMKGDKEKCIQAGASDYISKPIDVDKLLALMRVWLYKGI